MKIDVATSAVGESLDASQPTICCVEPSISVSGVIEGNISRSLCLLCTVSSNAVLQFLYVPHQVGGSQFKRRAQLSIRAASQRNPSFCTCVRLTVSKQTEIDVNV